MSYVNFSESVSIIAIFTLKKRAFAGSFIHYFILKKVMLKVIVYFEKLMVNILHLKIYAGLNTLKGMILM